MGDRSIAAIWDWFVHIPMLGAVFAWLAVMIPLWLVVFAWGELSKPKR
jgi:hypothetical protein